MNDVGDPFGKYTGSLIFEWLPDGRRMKLLESFGFVDSAQKDWPVPPQVIVDGASIPQPLWSIMGGPFEGKYRAASVVHDYYCDVRTRAWHDVHRVFYDAMRASGVSEARAKLMYAAVYYMGPRWNDTVVHNSNVSRPAMDVAYSVRHSEFQKAAFDAVALDGLSAHDFLRKGSAAYPEGSETVLKLDVLAEAIAKANPDLDEIDSALDNSLDLLETRHNRHERVLSGVERLSGGSGG